MLINIPPRSACKPSEITPENIYLSRRQFMGAASAAVTATVLSGWALADGSVYSDVEPGKAPDWFAEKQSAIHWKAVDVKGESITPFKDATQYNNFYEFGPDKGDPYANAGQMVIEPWTCLLYTSPSPRD